MKEEKKKKIRLKAELKVYNKIKSKIEKVLDDELDITDFEDYIFDKIVEIEEEIYNLDLVDEPQETQEAPKYGPGDEVFYEGIKCLVMAVSHKDKTYDIKSSGGRAWVSWNLIR